MIELKIASKAVRYHIYDPIIGGVIGSKRNCIVQFNTDDQNRNTFLGKTPFLDALPFSLVNRLGRKGIHNIIRLNDELFLIIVKGAFLLFDFYRKIIVGRVEYPRGSRPLRNGVCLVGNCILIAEYFMNHANVPVYLYRLNIENFTLDKHLEFDRPYNGLRDKDNYLDGLHIHFVVPMASNCNKVIFSTGDLDPQCGIYVLELDTMEIEAIGFGSQMWRAVSLLQKDGYWYWGTDCPYRKNHIIRYDYTKKTYEKVLTCESPFYYSTIDADGNMYMATTVERPDNHKAIIYRSKDGLTWQPVVEFKKDLWSPKYFGYGIIEFIHGQNYLNTLHVNLSGLHEKPYSIK
jgi:hypothetical protein